jgi:beta-phosphoglucomutase
VKIPQDLGVKDLQSVFVDLDGTLINSLPFLYSIYLNFLEHFSIQGTQEEFDSLNGPSLKEIVEILKSRYHLPESVYYMTKQYQNKINQVYKKDNIIVEDALKTVMYLKHKHLKLILVTSAHRDLAEIALHRPELNALFQGMITGEMVKNGKPNPEIYLLALMANNVKPENVIVLEDSLNGVQAALDAGLYTLRINPSAKGVQWHAGWAEFENWDLINNFFQELLNGLSDV